MQEKTILKVSLMVVVLGLTFLYFYAEELKLEPSKNIDSLEEEKIAKVRGTITRLTIQDKANFIELTMQNGDKVSIILFVEEELFLKEGDYIEAEGTVELYKGEKEILANKIVKK